MKDEIGIPKSGWINEERAINYLRNINNEPDLQVHYKRSLGRILDAEVFKDWYNTGDFGGIMAWYVAKKRGGVQFLAFEKKPKNFDYLKLSDQELSDLRPSSDAIYFSTKGFSRGIGNRNFDFGQYLRNQSNVGDPIRHIERGRKASEWISRYLEKDELRQHHSVAHGYLINNWKGVDYFKEFLFGQSREVKYIRYFFGFDPTEKKDRIRFFLVPVDEGGRNILLGQEDLGKFNDGNFLQNSWPPRPSVGS